VCEAHHLVARGTRQRVEMEFQAHLISSHLAATPLLTPTLTLAILVCSGEMRAASTHLVVYLLYRTGEDDVLLEDVAGLD
jgi:hypothetical protein